MTAGGKDEAAKRQVPPEVFELLPKLLWFGLAALAFGLAYEPLLRQINNDNVSKISVAAVQIEFARRQDFAAVAGQSNHGPPSPVQLKAFDERIQMIGQRFVGTRALWVSDDNANPTRYFLERRAFGALGISFDTAVNNAQAKMLLNTARDTHLPYDFVITDIHRDNKDGVGECFPAISGTPSEAGCETIELVKGYSGYDPSQPIPVIVYSEDASRGTPEGAIGAAAKFNALIPLVLDAVERRAPRPN